MLTADLVDARKRDGELLLRPLDSDAREEAHVIASTYLELARSFVGKRREELEEAWEAALSDEQASKRAKLSNGLRKLIEDECTFEAETSVDPVELRRVLFTHASEVRRSSSSALAETDENAAAESQASSRPPVFDREVVVAGAAKLLGIEPTVVESAMFADLRGEHLLRAAPALNAASIVEAWELGQTQAVLLSAVRVTCEVSSASAGLVRAFFAKLKFHKLLFTAERIDAKSWRVIIDGPYSMFDSVTKYGLRLALAWPAFRALEKWSLVADIKWGKTREPLVFRASSLLDGAGIRGDIDSQQIHQSDDVRELAAGIEALKAGWRVSPASVVLDVPGHGVCIPDLELTREGDGKEKAAPIYVEVLGYWSRDAVFKRVELAEKGLAGARVIFAISSRLRVSAEVLDSEKIPSSLYVYKGKMSPRLVLDHALKIAR